MNKKELMAEEIYQAVESLGLAKALCATFGSRVKVSVPFAKID